MLLRMGLLLRLGPNVIIQMGPLLHLGPIITLVPFTNMRMIYCHTLYKTNACDRYFIKLYVVFSKKLQS